MDITDGVSWYKHLYLCYCCPKEFKEKCDCSRKQNGRTAGTEESRAGTCSRCIDQHLPLNIPFCSFWSLCVCRWSQEKTKSALNLNKSVELTRAHLQGQLRNKEAENNRLTVQLRVFHPTVEEACRGKCRTLWPTLCFLVFRENTDWAKDEDRWFKRPYFDSEEEGRKGTRISEENLPSTEAESAEVWSCRWEILRWTEGEGFGVFKSAISIFFSSFSTHWIPSIFLAGTQDLQLTSARLELDASRWTKEKKRDETDKVVAHVDLLKRFVVPSVLKDPDFCHEKVTNARLFLKWSFRFDSETAEGGGEAPCSHRNSAAPCQKANRWKWRTRCRQCNAWGRRYNSSQRQGDIFEWQVRDVQVQDTELCECYQHCRVHGLVWQRCRCRYPRESWSSSWLIVSLRWWRKRSRLRTGNFKLNAPSIRWLTSTVS